MFRNNFEQIEVAFKEYTREDIAIAIVFSTLEK